MNRLNRAVADYVWQRDVRRLGLYARPLSEALRIVRSRFERPTLFRNARRLDTPPWDRLEPKGHPRAIDRIGRAGDGWFPLFASRGAVSSGIERISAVAAEAGRDPATIGLQCVVAETGDHDRQVEVVQGLAALGATHVGLATRARGTPDGRSRGMAADQSGC